MKRITLLLSIVLQIVCFHDIYSQIPDWTRLLQTGTYGPQTIDVVSADQNNVYMAASISGPITFEGFNYTSIGSRDMVIAKISNAGEVLWIKQFNAQSNGIIYANAIKIDAAGNVFVSGVFSGTSTIGGNTVVSSNSINAFLAKLDVNGNGLWVTSFLNNGTGISIIALDDIGNLYLNSGSSKLLKFNSNGIVQWEQSYRDKTLQAIAVYGSNLYVGGALQSGITNFGTISLTSLGGYNTGFIVKANLDGVYSKSIVVGGSSNGGSSVSDIVFDNYGNLIITGCYTKDLILGTLTITNPSQSYYTYLAKCDNNFSFSWSKSSTSLFFVPNSMYSYKLFVDSFNKIYEYVIHGSLVYSLSYGSVSTSSGQNQFIFKFDENGIATNVYSLQNTSVNRIVVSPIGKILTGCNNSTSGTTSYGNFYLKSLNSSLTSDWEKASVNSFSGTVRINYIKHDSAKNTYIQSRVLGYCNYFGTIINTNNYLTVISKHDIDGKLLWIKQIADLSPNYNGPIFTLDKDNNILTAGFFQTSLAIGATTLTTAKEREAYVAKISSSGDFQWVVKTDVAFGISLNISIATDNDGNILVSGVGGDRSNYLMKINAAGNKLWEKLLPMESIYWCFVSADANNNIYIVSEVHLSDKTGSTTIGSIPFTQAKSDGSTALVKFDPDGNALWAKTYGGIIGSSYSDGWAVDIRTDDLGNTYLWGWCNNNSIFGTTTLTNPLISGDVYFNYLTKINTLGEVVWAKAVYEKGFCSNYGDLLDLDNDGNVYVGGHYKDRISIEGAEYLPEGKNDFFVLKYSNSGIFQWIKTMPSDARNIFALDVFSNNILSLVGFAGKNSTLAGSDIVNKGGSSCIITTLGNLISPILTVSTNSLTIDSPASGTKTFDIVSNISWTATSDQTWLIVNSANGSRNATITLTASENPTTATRTAKVTVSGSGVASQVVTVVQSGGVTGVDVLSNDRGITLFPNPSNGKITIGLNNYDGENVIVRVTNSIGNMVKMVRLKNLSGKDFQEIDLNGLLDGVYFITIQTSKTRVVKPIVLTHSL